MNTLTPLAIRAIAVLAAAIAGPCAAQQIYPQQTYQQFQQQPAADKHPMRTMFAASLAQVAQTSGSTAIVAMADGLTGALKGWFDNKRARKGVNGALGTGYYPQNTQQQPSSGYPGPSPDPAGYPPSSYPQSGDPQSNYPQSNYPQSNYPESNYPAPSDAGGYPQSGAYPPVDSGAGSYPPAEYPDPNAAVYPQANSSGYPPAQTSSAGTASQLPAYAGIAYEIHLLQADGSTAPVDPASYTFRTGDRFTVYYRPSLPGRIDVFNINAAGQNTQIDTSTIAAGQLASLGPYEFTDLQGEETLILKLSPCMTPALYAVTRTIVKAQGAQQTAGNSLGLGDCSSTTTRGVRPKTRDIRKVSVEGGTAFALDPISTGEAGSGGLAPRQITITLHHH
jgi:hypothetical protein